MRKAPRRAQFREQISAVCAAVHFGSVLCAMFNLHSRSVQPFNNSTGDLVVHKSASASTEELLAALSDLHCHSELTGIERLLKCRNGIKEKLSSILIWLSETEAL